MSYQPADAKSIFLQAMELPSAAERMAFVERACAGQPQLQERVKILLKTALDPDSLLDQPAAELDATQTVPHDAHSLDFLRPCDEPGALGKLGAYTVLEVIGRGGMGIVLRAMDSKLHRVVAIKVLAPEFAGNLQARKRFLREAQAAAAVSHDHVVTIHAVDDDEKLPLIVMECIVGQSLQQKIDRVGALRLNEILRIGMQTAAGLAAAHAQGLVHRDVKPANILLENGVERVKLTDFGLARMVDDASVTQSGIIAGTPQFMSPEQARGDSIDHRSDLFSLGCVMYAMCVGHAPFRASTTMGVLKRVCDEAPRPIHDGNPDIPAWLIKIVDKLLAKSPADRFQTTSEVADLLRRCLAHCQQPNQVPLPEVIRTLGGTIGSGSMNERSAPSTVIGGQSTRQPNAIMYGSLVAVAVLGIAVCVWQFWPSSPAADRITAQNQVESRTKKSAVTPEVEPETPLTAPASAIAPFSAAQAKEHQDAWAKYLATPVELTNSLGMKFQLIPPGKFQMGSSSEELDQLKQEVERLNASDFEKFCALGSGPRHVVELSQPFYLGTYEVTIANYRQFLEEAKYIPTAERVENPRLNWKMFVPNSDPAKQPVCGVSWDDARAFCQWLGDKTSTAKTQEIYDLPSEAQWEYACRAGSQTLWSFGNDVQGLSEYAIYGLKGTPYPAAIGLRRANAFGLFDMHGNVDEWCLDWHNHQYYARSPLVDPLYNDAPNDAASGRVARGGAWNADAWWSRSTTRAYDFPTSPNFSKGFRIVRKIPPKSGAKLVSW